MSKCKGFRNYFHFNTQNGKDNTLYRIIMSRINIIICGYQQMEK